MKKDTKVDFTTITPDQFSSFFAPEITLAGGKFSIRLDRGDKADAQWVFEMLGRKLGKFKLEAGKMTGGISPIETQHLEAA